MTRNTETIVAFNLPNGRGFRIDQHSEDGIVVLVEGMFLDGPIATEENEDGETIDAVLIYENVSKRSW